MRVMCWYGDDFTGSTDALEALAPHMPSVLFLRQPDEAVFQQFAEYSAFGLAGISRSESPEWMDANLPRAFEWLKSLGAGLCHYKVCSSFDSSPTVGNIGRAMEIGKRVFGGGFVPLVVGAPALRRYTFFGNLFAAAADGKIYRIDRHPSMMNHPVTPMREADLRLHLKEQTDLRVGLADDAEMLDAVLIDVMDESSLRRAGQKLWDEYRQPFVVGSSGVEYALIAHWGYEKKEAAAPAAVDRLIVLSGSCSPSTARQIDYAGANGFGLVPIAESEDAAVRAALHVLSNGKRGVVVHTPRERIESFGPAERKRLGERAARILDRLLNESGVRRVVIAGGDTSSHAGQLIGIDALTFVAHLAPGAPLCKAWSRAANRQGLEFVFKGGQCGNDDFFELVRGKN
jgi:uncharacterized protein YgbK (DUF1537 family)